MEPTSKKTKSRPKLNPTESAAIQRLEHDLITDSGTVPATKGRHAPPPPPRPPPPSTA